MHLSDIYNSVFYALYFRLCLSRQFVTFLNWTENKFSHFFTNTKREIPSFLELIFFFVFGFSRSRSNLFFYSVDDVDCVALFVSVTILKKSQQNFLHFKICSVFELSKHSPNKRITSCWFKYKFKWPLTATVDTSTNNPKHKHWNFILANLSVYDFSQFGVIYFPNLLQFSLGILRSFWFCLNFSLFTGFAWISRILFQQNFAQIIKYFSNQLIALIFVNYFA